MTRRTLFVVLPALAFGQEERLLDRWNRFVKTGKEFAQTYNRGEFNVRLARKMSKEWREVEGSGEWPK